MNSTKNDITQWGLDYLTSHGYTLKSNHHGLTEQDAAYKNIKDACFKNFIRFESKENILTIFELTKTLLPIYSALAHYRLIEACDKTQLKSYYGSGKINAELKNFMSIYMEN